MSVPAGWVLAPLVLVLVAVGTGLLTERVARWRLPGAILPAVGLAAAIVVAGPFTLLDATAELAAPAALVAALAGYAVTRPWRDPRLRAAWPWPLVVAAGAYALFAAPSVLSGQASVAGYLRLDDSATWLALTDQVFTHGRDLSYLAPSTYQRTLEVWLGGGYPVGSMLPLGITAQLTGQDPAAAYQSTIAVYAAIAALGLFACARPLVRHPGLAAAAALVAIQASVFVGYAQWGGIKEAATAALLPPLAVLAVEAGRRDAAAPLALLCLVAGGLLAILGLNGLAWAAPALGVAVLGMLVARRSDAAPAIPRMLRRAAGAAVVLAVASLPALVEVDFLRQTTGGAISAPADLGNLVQPLPLLQGAGLWPTADFRLDPDPRWLGVVFALAGLAGAAACVILAARRRAWELPALAAITLTGTTVAVAIGSPWVDAKALAESAPVLLLAAASLVAVGLAARDAPALRVSAVAGAAVVVVGCSWSTVAVVDGISVAPRERLAELRAIGDRIAGQGPTIVLDFETFAQRHFLRAADPEGATDLRVRPVTRADGGVFPRLSTAEVDEIATPDLWAYRTIVRRRSPVASRPPRAFRRIWTGRGFEVWQRDARAQAPLARLALGDADDPTAVPDCGRVRALARTPGVRAIAAVPRRPPVVVDLSRARLPSRWREAGAVMPVSNGRAALEMRVPAAGRWRLWVAGSARGRLAGWVRRRAAGSLRHELAHRGQWMRFEAVALRPGRTPVELAYSGDALAGAGGAPWPLGPVALSPPEADGALPVVEVAPSDAGRLCGRRLDWVEALP